MIIEQIQKRYKKKVILETVSFEAESGQCIGLLGSNGSGKSTLLSILAGIIKADNGKFLYDGTDLLQNNKLRSELVGYVPQSAPLLEELNAKDNLKLWYSPEDMEQELSSGVLGMLGIPEFIKTPVYKMSGGMKKRLSIGCAVAHKPKILLLDEPSSALDLICKERIAVYLQEFKAKGGIILLATHDLQELPLCDQLYILKNGTLEPFAYNGDVHKLVGRL
ncbi:MAG: ABC transporter ATP-binding protein [Clostridia bacterium]|nr:ABC transporter ATP-binding protein [Clostridia bacterium]